jgi:hypothetical protein
MKKIKNALRHLAEMLLLLPVLVSVGYAGSPPMHFFTLGIATATRNGMLDKIRTDMDAGATGALLRVYDGSRPATGGTATVKLAELVFTDPAAPAASGGVLTFSAITKDSSADATGTATWCRVVDSTGAFVFDGSVGTSAADYILGTTSIALGNEVTCTSGTLTAGNP